MCSQSMSMEAGSELGRFISHNNSVVDRNKKDFIGEMILSELKEEEKREEANDSKDSSQVVKIVQSNKVICIPFLNLDSIKDKSPNKKKTELVGEITPAGFEVADCSAILPLEDEVLNSSKMGNISFALDTSHQLMTEEPKKPPVMIFDEVESKEEKPPRARKQSQFKGEKVVEESLLISPIACSEEAGEEKVSKDSSMEMPSFLKESAPNLLINYEEVTQEVSSPENNTKKKKKKGKSPTKRKEERGRKKKKSPEPGHIYMIKDKRSRSSSSDKRKQESQQINQLVLMGQSLSESSKRHLHDIPSMISLKQIQA